MQINIHECYIPSALAVGHDTHVMHSSLPWVLCVWVQGHSTHCELYPPLGTCVSVCSWNIHDSDTKSYVCLPQLNSLLCNNGLECVFNNMQTQLYYFPSFVIIMLLILLFVLVVEIGSLEIEFAKGYSLNFNLILIKHLSNIHGSVKILWLKNVYQTLCLNEQSTPPGETAV